MKIKSQRDFFSGLLFLVVGLAFGYGATAYEFGKTSSPGPGFFPLLLAGSLVVLGAVVVFTSLAIETDDGEPVGDIAWRPLCVTVFSILMFGALFPRLGLLLSVPLLVVVVSTAGRDFRWVPVLITAAVLTLFAWAVFIKGLGLVLPVWPELPEGFNWRFWQGGFGAPGA